MRTVPACLFALAALSAAWLSIPASAQPYALCPPETPVADWLPYVTEEPTLTAAPTRWPHPFGPVTFTQQALATRDARDATYAAWLGATPAVPWPFGQATITATATVTFTPGVTATATVTATAAEPVSPTYTLTPTATVTATIRPVRTVAQTPTATIRPTLTVAPTVEPTPVLFPCRFTPTRCGTRVFVPFNGKGRRR